MKRRLGQLRRLGLGGLRASIVALLAVGLATAPAQATPIDYGKDESGANIKPYAFPAGSTINIYIEQDPDAGGVDRSALMKEGLERWKDQMSKRDITINVVVGDIPEPAPANLVKVQYKPDGTTYGDPPNQVKIENKEGKPQGAAGPSPGTGGTLTGGVIYIGDWLPDATDNDKHFIRNLAQHELTHVLGLGDDPVGEVTDGEQSDQAANSFNDRDEKEIAMLYPEKQKPPPKAAVSPVQTPDPRKFWWSFEYQGEPEDHVSLILLDIEPSLIDTIFVPLGWEWLDPRDPDRFNMTYHFYDGYVVDYWTEQAPYNTGYDAYLSFRSPDEVYVLSDGNPTLMVGVHCEYAYRGPIRVWAGDETQIVEGPRDTPVSVEESTWGRIKAMYR